MANTPQSQQTKLNLQMREILANAYGFVRGREYTKTIGNMTYEDLIDRAIDRIEGSPGQPGGRATILDRIAKIKQEIVNAVTTVKSQPPSAWVIANQDQEVDQNDMANPPAEVGI